MQFYFAVAVAIFVAILMQSNGKDILYSDTSDWLITIAATGALSLLWPIIFVGVIVESYLSIMDKEAFSQ